MLASSEEDKMRTGLLLFSMGVVLALPMQTTVASAQSGAVLLSTDNNPFVGVKIAAGGQETRQFHSGPYRMENFSKQGRINVKMNFADDRGNPSVYDGIVNVQHVGEVRRLTE
jgi:hypothetical protein